MGKLVRKQGKIHSPYKRLLSLFFAGAMTLANVHSPVLAEETDTSVSPTDSIGETVTQVQEEIPYS